MTELRVQLLGQFRVVVDGRPVDGGEHLLASDNAAVWLPREQLRVDVEQFRDAIGRARRQSATEEYRRAVGIYASDLLPDDRYEDWAESPREQLRLNYLAVLKEPAGCTNSPARGRD